MAKTPEGIIQTYAQEQLKKRGCLVRKISYEGRRGCPDLLALVPEREIPYAGNYDPEKGIAAAKTLFLEIKKDEQTKPDPHQQREHERIRQHGGDVRVIGSKEHVDSLLSELFPCD
ncbi:hypothetical protein [Salmonella phage PhiSTP2]|nr:hypothetical protein [Salmonella phage PhiSTP2]